MEARVRELIDAGVDSQIIPVLMDYIRVPSLSPAFDTEWETNGLMQEAQNILINYVKSLEISGFSYDIIKDEGHPWLFFGEVAATEAGKPTVLMYGHMDKQPHFTGWMEGIGPCDPKIIDNKLYGRGGADDGYSLPGAALVIKTMQTLGIPHGRIVIVAENEEESGSGHLIEYITKLSDRIGKPEMVICLDSGAGNYDQFWITSSLRGALMLNLNIDIMSSGQHSGAASGIAPSTFRILRELLDRLEDSRTGEMKVPELFTEITPEIYRKAVSAAEALGDHLYELPWLEGVRPVTTDKVQAILNNTYRPTLCVTGADGLPDLPNAGNVLRPHTGVRLSIRLPPGVDPKVAGEAVKAVLLKDPPYGAKVDVQLLMTASGWAPKSTSEWLDNAFNEASMNYFQKNAVYFGEGGSIPFIAMLGDMFPEAEFLVTGLLGPANNAHAANEMMRIDFLKSLLCCICHILAKQANH